VPDEKIMLIVYHSQSGNTARLASAVEEGASRILSISVSKLPAGHVSSELLVSCRVLVLCSPEYFGYMAGAMKDLFDRTYEVAREHTAGKSYAVVISAGNDGTGALAAIERILLGYRMKRVQEPIIQRGEVVEAGLEKCRSLGETLAAGMDLGIY
jgi:multimeric flavodoxin WrbA